MDKLIAMATFVQIVERGSLTQAADSIGTSLPSVVRTLAALEETLGVRLLNRTTRRMSLTQEGRQYLARCRTILMEIEEAETELSSQRQEPQGELRVTAPVLFGRRHVAPIVNRYIRQFSQTSVELLLLDRVVNLVEEGIDVAIRIGQTADNSLISIPAGLIRRVVCASPKYLKERGTPREPIDLLKHNCLGLTWFTPGAGWIFYNKGREQSVSVKGSFVCNNAETTIDACIDGLGVGTFWSYQVAPLVAQMKLKLLLNDYAPPPTPLSIVYPHAKLLSSRVRIFSEMAIESLRAEFDVKKTS
jgi:DNA-binding transcriptional LysR family regulator